MQPISIVEFLIYLLLGIVLGMLVTDFFWLEVLKHLDEITVCP
ncbi:hypothetical protein Sbal117_2319 [Shewanella baltica OS117]|nr:hypothetical protein Sbal117_2309 [Shewanella baltica OS117]AEH14040.1 hypothetical protein Sbal117_2319 [Shewanella baltica OS117]